MQKKFRNILITFMVSCPYAESQEISLSSSSEKCVTDGGVTDHIGPLNNAGVIKSIYFTKS